MHDDLPALIRLDENARRLEMDLARGGHAYVACVQGRVVGLAVARRMPGLEGHLDLQVCIEPDCRRQGYGTLLVQRFLPALRAAGVRMASTEVHSLESAVARLLLHNGFFREHDEWDMIRSDLRNLPDPALPEEFQVLTYPRGQAIAAFRQLYEEAFSAQPSYQPYTSDAEVSQELDAGQDLLFLADRIQPVGFAWLRHVDSHLGEIEPLGLVPAYQGKGLGRRLLLAGLHELHTRGYRQARLGVWANNARAVRLYGQLGFEQVASRFYLAYDLQGK